MKNAKVHILELNHEAWERQRWTNRAVLLYTSVACDRVSRIELKTTLEDLCSQHWALNSFDKLNSVSILGL